MGVNIAENYNRQTVLIKSSKRNKSRKFRESYHIVSLLQKKSAISKGRRSIRSKKGGSAAAVIKPNAVNSDNNMAPALTEPLNSTEKLSSSAATATPSTRSSKKFDSAAASTSFATSSSSNLLQQKDKKNRNASTPLNSTRLTRSNHAYQRVFEEAVTPLVVSYNTTSNSTEGGVNTEVKPMGLSAAQTTVNHTKNNETKAEAAPNSIVADPDHCKDNSTAQLLADLTNDFEEAITAEICLRKHFQDANLNKVASQSDIGDTKDILVIKAGSGGAVKVNSLLPHMESDEIFQSNEVNPREASGEGVLLDERVVEINDVSRSSDLRDASPQKSEVIDELPHISTDSTITASEVEDNLEERLSQLDGTIVAPIKSHEGRIIASEIDETFSIVANSTKTPPTTQPISQPVHPHSIPSTVNTMVNSNFPQGPIKETGCVTVSVGGASGEIEDPDIDEVLCALKDFDGTSAGDTLCDLNVLLNEVYTTLNYEDINNQSTASIAKSNPLKELHVDMEKKHQTMQRKIDFLLRRLRKLQARYMSKHTSEEIAGIFELSARTVSRGAGSTDLNQQKMEPISAISVISSRPDPNIWADERKNPVPLAQMATMLRKLQTVANAQQVCTEPTSSSVTPMLRKTKKTQDLFGTSPLTVTTDSKHESLVPTFDLNAVEELRHVAGLLQSEMREVQNAIDSDATESSSGGESADEMVTYNNQIQQSLSIAKRAAWRYSRDRAAIASRWSWLHSQISDLEIKIRQHSELNLDVGRTKGAVVCSNSNAVGSKHKTTATISATTSVNGYKGEMSTMLISEGRAKPESDTEEGSGACRTRGIDISQFLKRKLLQTTNIHTISKKAARPSTLKCGCQWPLHPCAVCTGRVDPTAPRDLPDTMMMPDRVALLDPGFHPVLSFTEDISSSIHLEAIARTTEWQHRVMRSQVKNIAKSLWKAERIATGTGHHYNSKRYNDTSIVKRRYVKKKDRIGRLEKPGKNSTASNDVGNMSTTPLVANSKLLNEEKSETRSLPSSGRWIADGAAITSGDKQQPTQQQSESEQQQQLHSSKEQFSSSKIRAIQSQPSTFIIDLQQHPQKQQTP